MSMDEGITQLVIVVGIFVLMLAAMIFDGEIGLTISQVLIAGLGLILGYFFRKAQDDKISK